jgi:hypothetical protein
MDEANLVLWHCPTQEEGHARGLGSKRMTWGNLQVWTRGDLTAILWRDKRNVRILTNIHAAPTEGNFCDNNGKAIKPQIVADYNCHMGYVDKGSRMTNTYSINRRTWKWTNKLFFHLAILNGHNLFSSLGGKKMLHRDFQNTLLWNLLAQAGHEPKVQRSRGRPPFAVTQVIRFEDRDRKHWPILSATRRRCCAYAARIVTRNVSVICERCNIALCCDTTCFQDYHISADP